MKSCDFIDVKEHFIVSRYFMKQKMRIRIINTVKKSNMKEISF